MVAGETVIAAPLPPAALVPLTLICGLQRWCPGTCARVKGRLGARGKQVQGKLGRAGSPAYPGLGLAVQTLPRPAPGSSPAWSPENASPHSVVADLGTGSLLWDSEVQAGLACKGFVQAEAPAIHPCDAGNPFLAWAPGAWGSCWCCPEELSRGPCRRGGTFYWLQEHLRKCPQSKGPTPAPPQPLLALAPHQGPCGRVGAAASRALGGVLRVILMRGLGPQCLRCHGLTR